MYAYQLAVSLVLRLDPTQTGHHREIRVSWTCAHHPASWGTTPCCLCHWYLAAPWDLDRWGCPRLWRKREQWQLQSFDNDCRIPPEPVERMGGEEGEGESMCVWEWERERERERDQEGINNESDCSIMAVHIPVHTCLYLNVFRWMCTCIYILAIVTCLARWSAMAYMYVSAWIQAKQCSCQTHSLSLKWRTNSPSVNDPVHKTSLPLIGRELGGPWAPG